MRASSGLTTQCRLRLSARVGHRDRGWDPRSGDNVQIVRSRDPDLAAGTRAVPDRPLSHLPAISSFARHGR